MCGISGQIDSLTKMAKLDFFARYPDFFEAARVALAPADAVQAHNLSKSGEAIESAMVRHHYGPWDKRYYHVLAHLEAKRLIAVTKEGRSYRIALTELGRERAQDTWGAAVVCAACRTHARSEEDVRHKERQLSQELDLPSLRRGGRPPSAR